MFSAVLDELVGLTDVELEQRIEQNELVRRRGDAEMAACLAIAKARNLHGIDGHRSMAGFCRAKLNWSTTEAGRRLGLAHAVNEMPGLGEAWAAGHIGYPQAIKLSMANANERVADALPKFTEQLLLHAEQMPYKDFVEVVDHFVKRADEDGAHDDRDAAIKGRTARVAGVGGTLDVRASGGDGLTTAEVEAIHTRFVDIEFKQDIEANRLAHGNDAHNFALSRTNRQRRFDALIAIFRAAATVGDVGTVAEPLVNVMLDADTWGKILLAAGLSGNTNLDGQPVDPFTGLPNDEAGDLLDDLTDPATQTCETSSGAPLHAHDVLRAALAGHVRRVIVDSEHVVIDLGRRQRLFTGSTRQAAELLIKRCEHAGCEMPTAWCDVDHDLEWNRDHGSTDQQNGRILCRGHNLDKHRRRWRTKRARNGSSYTIREDGTIILPVGARPPNFADVSSGNGGRGHLTEAPEEFARTAVLARNRIDDLIRTTNR
jgi:hypothetical protein